VAAAVVVLTVVLIADVVGGLGGGSSLAAPTKPQVRVHHRRGLAPVGRVPSGPPSDQRRLSLLTTISGHISPKSVASSNTGLVFAQNMMYTHTITVYDSRGSLVKTIPDTVQMSDFGIAGHPGITHGAPVEAAFTPDSKYAYVSNYSMYGTGYGPEGLDSCTPESARAAGDTDSYVYRINTATLAIDQVIRVGLVPKFLTLTPNGRYLLDRSRRSRSGRIRAAWPSHPIHAPPTWRSWDLTT
jgi:DNA-binding beta-propeller fold protein YncE